MQPLSADYLDDLWGDEEETGELEKALKKAKSPEEILTVFNSILIKE
jgi:hypothetical protein